MSRSEQTSHASLKHGADSLEFHLLQVEHLKAGKIARVRHLAIAGISEEKGFDILGSPGFQGTSGTSLHSIEGLALKFDLPCLQQ